VNRLIQAADRQRRLIWATLPFHYRWAELLIRLAVDPQTTFGQIIYTVFLRRGVTGMPEINGKPAEEYDLNKAPHHLVPPGYGRDFASKVWAAAVRLLGPDGAQDMMQELMLTIQSRPEKLSEGRTLSQAQGYVLGMLKLESLEAIRLRKRHPGDYGEHLPAGGGEDDAPKVELADTSAVVEIMEWINEQSRGKVMPALMRDLARIPGAVPYVQAVLRDGLTDAEIVGDYRKGRPAAVEWFQENPMTVQNFGNRVKPKIREVFQKYVQDLRSDAN
jgi:hypothetical protein